MKSSVRTLDSKLALGYILYLLWPLAVLFIAIKKVEYPKYRTLLLCFAAFFGYNFVVLENSDGSRVIGSLQYYANMDLYEFISFLSSIFSTENATPDYYLHIISFLVSRISLDPHFFTAVLSIIYFYVYFKIFGFLNKLETKTLSFYSIIILLGIVIMYPFTAGINAVRFPLATLLYIYAFINLVFKRDRKFLFLGIVSVLIHWSFLGPSLLLILYYFTQKYNNMKVLLAIMIVTIFVSTFLSQNLAANIGFLGGVYEDKFDTYTDENYVESRNVSFATMNLHIKLAKILPIYYIMIILFITNFSNLKLIKDEYSNRLYIFAIYVACIAFILGGAIDIVNNRFIRLAYIFTLIYFFYLSLINRNNKWIRLLSVVFVPIFLLQLYATIRSDILCIEPNLLLGNWITAIFMSGRESIFDLIN